MLTLKSSSAIRQQLANPNYLAVYRAIWQHGPITRNRIAELTRLAIPTVCRIVRNLTSQGLVQCLDELQSMGGRPPGRLSVVTKSNFLIGVDLGGTKLAGTLVDLDATPLTFQVRPVNDNNAQSLTDAILGLVEGLISEARIEARRIIGIGLSVPGAIDRARGIVVEASNLNVSNWHVVEAIQEAFQIPVHIENDANAGVLAEMYFGDGQLERNLAFVNVGTGIGMGLVIGERVFRGDLGHAGEIGHVVFDLAGPVCSCGRRGCLEAYAGGWAIVRNYREEAGAVSAGAASSASETVETAEDVFCRSRAGDPVAAAVLARASDALGLALSNLVYLLGIRHIVLGGGIVVNNKQFFESARDRALSLIPAKYREGIRIVQTALGGRAGVMGAAAIVLQDLFDVQIRRAQRGRGSDLDEREQE